MTLRVPTQATAREWTERHIREIARQEINKAGIEPPEPEPCPPCPVPEKEYGNIVIRVSISLPSGTKNPPISDFILQYWDSDYKRDEINWSSMGTGLSRQITVNHVPVGVFFARIVVQPFIEGWYLSPEELNAVASIKKDITISIDLRLLFKKVDDTWDIPYYPGPLSFLIGYKIKPVIFAGYLPSSEEKVGPPIAFEFTYAGPSATAGSSPVSNYQSWYVNMKVLGGRYVEAGAVLGYLYCPRAENMPEITMDTPGLNYTFAPYREEVESKIGHKILGNDSRHVGWEEFTPLNGTSKHRYSFDGPGSFFQQSGPFFAELINESGLATAEVLGSGLDHLKVTSIQDGKEAQFLLSTLCQVVKITAKKTDVRIGDNIVRVDELIFG